MANEHDERIAQIKARLDARTEGEWWCWEQGTGNIAVHVTNSEGYIPIATIENGYGDAEFIANAPADVDYLLEHVAKLEADLDAKTPPLNFTWASHWAEYVAYRDKAWENGLTALDYVNWIDGVLDAARDTVYELMSLRRG